MPLLLPYKSGSQSAKALAEGLGVKRVLLRNENAARHAGKTIINWGNSTYPMIPRATYLNSPEAINNATNKLSAFRIMGGRDVCIPQWTTDQQEAQSWKDEGHAVVERHKLQGHSAEGLRLVGINDELQRAPLYTKYVKKSDEYRVHVMDGKVFHVQRKARRADVPDDEVNWQVRNHANGFIYQINLDRPVPEHVLLQAKKAIRALNLTFGAVDVIFNKYHNVASVLEVNTACGLEGTTLEKYVQAIKSYLRGDAIDEFVQPDEQWQQPPRIDDPDPEPVVPRQEPQEARDDDNFVQEIDHPNLEARRPENDNERVQEEMDVADLVDYIDRVQDINEVSAHDRELLRKEIVKLNTWFMNLEN